MQLGELPPPLAAALDTLRDMGALDHDGVLKYTDGDGRLAEYIWTVAYAGDAAGMWCECRAKSGGYVVCVRRAMDPTQTSAVAMHMHDSLLELARACAHKHGAIATSPTTHTYIPMLAATAAVAFLGCMASLVYLGAA